MQLFSRIAGQPKRARRAGIGFALAALSIGGLGAAAHRANAAPRAMDEDVYLEADISERTLTIYNGDETVHTYPVAVGRESKPTPRGTFRIRKIIWNPEWIPPDQPWARHESAKGPGEKGNPMKVVKIFFKEPDYYIHGTGNTESLGSAASHGCLRMDPDDAYHVARYIMEHGGEPRDENWFWRVLHFRREMKTVYLDHPVPIVITN